MKKILAFILLISIYAIGYALTADEILKDIESNKKYKTSSMDSIMTIYDGDKKISEMGMTSYTKKDKNNDDMQLSRFISPARLAGTAILSKDGSVWYYNKRTNRVRLLSKSAKKGSMMGSSFSYDDMSMDYIDDFDSEIIEENRNEYIIKLIPKDKDKDYIYQYVYIDKKLLVENKIEYYNDNEKIYKKMILGETVTIDGIITPLIITMDEIYKGKSTVIKVDKQTVKYNENISDNYFSEKNLKK